MCNTCTAKESIKEYATEYLPEQYQVCLSALDTILKHASEIDLKQQRQWTIQDYLAHTLFHSTYDNHIMVTSLITNSCSLYENAFFFYFTLL
jgi:hypothetical protein